jgi:hypothetical protein
MTEEEPKLKRRKIAQSPEDLQRQRDRLRITTKPPLMEYVPEDKETISYIIYKLNQVSENLERYDLKQVLRLMRVCKRFSKAGNDYLSTETNVSWLHRR